MFERTLEDLLAILHGDGGQYQNAHTAGESYKHAADRYYALREEVGNLEWETENLKRDLAAARAIVIGVDNALRSGSDENLGPQGLTREEAIERLKRERDKLRSRMFGSCSSCACNVQGKCTQGFTPVRECEWWSEKQDTPRKP